MSAVNATATAAGKAAAEMPLPVVDSGHSVLVTLGYLSLLLGVIFLGYWLMKRLGFHGMGVHAGKGAPQLLTRLMLGNRQSVAVVRYRDKDLVLGVTDERINLLKEFDADDSDIQEVEPKNFAKLLKRNTNDEG